MSETHTFGFPTEAQDKIGEALRAQLNGQELDARGNPVLRSVRPERQPKMRMTSSTVEGSFVQPAPVSNVQPMGARTAPLEADRVVVELPPSTPITSPDGISIDLPSKFFYYPFKDLYIKPLRVPQLSKLAKADETGSLQTQVEAISSVLFTSTGETDIGFKLTTADYNAVLYWLRLTSYSKPTMRVKSLCKNPEHHKQVKAGLKARDTLLIETVYTKSDLKYDYLDQAPDPAVYQITLDVKGSKEVVTLRPETMAETIQFLDHPKWADEEFAYMSKIAATLGNVEVLTGTRWTWDQRIQLVEQILTPDQAVLCTQFAEIMDSYGVREKISVHCKECGYKGDDVVTCDPQTFLAPSF